MRLFRDYQPLINLMAIGSPILGILIGALFAELIQSSATVAIAITLAGSGLVSLSAVLP
jgi:phosphate:Na+ symporter